jgi:hypothetical protein
MKNIFKLYLLLVSLVMVQAAYADNKDNKNNSSLKGSLQDEKGEAVSFANVAVLMASDSSLVSGAVTDLDGNFLINVKNEGDYILRLSAIGFANNFTEPFKVQGEKDFGTIILKEDVQVLGEVEVTALRPTVVAEADKMVVSVEGTALAAGSTAMEVLEKSPGVWVDQDGNIQLNGKAGVKIMIDGRPSYLSAKELQSMLESMTAANIKNIELIANPTAKYDAEGSSGVINIQLKKNTMMGMNGSIFADYTNNSKSGYRVGTNINYKNGKWNSFVNLDMGMNPHRRRAVMTREFHNNDQETYFDQKGAEYKKNTYPSARFGTDYQLNDKHSIGVMVNLSAHGEDGRFDTDTYVKDVVEGSHVFVDAYTTLDVSSANGTFNLHYNGELDTTGTSISADLNYIRLSEQIYSDFYNEEKNLYTDAITKSFFTSDNPSAFDIYSAQVDFSKKVFGKGKLELGAKASQVISDNSVDFFQLIDDEKIPDPKRSNHFLYKENIYAAYTTFSTPIGEKLSVQAGLRMEHTTGEGNGVTRADYTKLFPSLFVQHKVSDNYQVSYNYSRRINRPGYWSLNPFIFYLDPYTVILGNPELRPQYSNSFQITQSLKNSYILTLSYSQSKDMMAEVPRQDVEGLEKNTTAFGPNNIDKGVNFNATLVAPVRLHKKWEISNNLTAAYQKTETFLDGHDFVRENIFVMAQQTHNIMLPKDFRLQLTGRYLSPQLGGVYKIEGFWDVDAGVKKSLFKDKLDLNLSVSDIFASQQIVGNANIEENVNMFDQYFFRRKFKFSIRYNFTKGEKFKANNKRVNLEELNRAGG